MGGNSTACHLRWEPGASYATHSIHFSPGPEQDADPARRLPAGVLHGSGTSSSPVPDPESMLPTNHHHRPPE